MSDVQAQPQDSSIPTDQTNTQPTTTDTVVGDATAGTQDADTGTAGGDATGGDIAPDVETPTTTEPGTPVDNVPGTDAPADEAGQTTDTPVDTGDATTGSTTDVVAGDDTSDQPPVDNAGGDSILPDGNTEVPADEPAADTDTGDEPAPVSPQAQDLVDRILSEIGEIERHALHAVIAFIEKLDPNLQAQIGSHLLNANAEKEVDRGDTAEG